jgi:hypothetical protein
MDRLRKHIRRLPFAAVLISLLAFTFFAELPPGASFRHGPGETRGGTLIGALLSGPAPAFAQPTGGPGPGWTRRRPITLRARHKISLPDRQDTTFVIDCGHG